MVNIVQHSFAITE